MISMRLGILSDSHGRFERTRAALRLLEKEGASCIVHCGDVGGVSVFDELVGRNVRFVWGNTDYPDASLREYLRAVGLVEPDSVPLRLDFGGKSVAVFHGHESQFQTALATGGVDYILHGHTHVARDEHIGGVRVINPGALHRARVFTVATLDVHQGTACFHELD